MKIITLRDADYDATLTTQREIFAEMVARKRRGEPAGDLERLFLVEHKPVYTLGLHAHRSNIIDRGLIESRGACVRETERGGDVTFHGPGQLVAYPLVDFGARGLGVKGYVDLLEEAVIRTISAYGIKGERMEGATGVWVKGNEHRPDRKICAIGIKCSRYAAMHGLALNVNTDLSWFGAINPCGFTDKGVTSIALESGRDAVWEEAAQLLAAELTALLKKDYR